MAKRKRRKTKAKQDNDKDHLFQGGAYPIRIKLKENARKIVPSRVRRQLKNTFHYAAKDDTRQLMYTLWKLRNYIGRGWIPTSGNIEMILDALQVTKGYYMTKDDKKVKWDIAELFLIDTGMVL